MASSSVLVKMYRTLFGEVLNFLKSLLRLRFPSLRPWLQATLPVPGRDHDRITIPCTDLLSWAFKDAPQVDRDRDVSKQIWVNSYDPSVHVDTRTAREMVRKLIRGLRQKGLQAGDVVCLHAFNNVWYPVIYLAVIGAGGVFVGSNPAYKPSELEHLFTSSQAKFLIVDTAQIDNVIPTASKIGITSDRTFIFDGTFQSSTAGLETCSHQHSSGTFESWRQLMKHGEDDWISFDDKHQSQNTPAVYLSSSGTTGLPKVVVMSHYAIVTQLVYADFQAGSVSHEIRRLVALPFFHAFALPLPVLSMRRHETLYIMPRFSANDCIDFVERYKITMMPVVPPMAKLLFGESQSSDTLRRLASLTEVISAGAPLGGETQRALASRLSPSTRFVQLWGMSESGWVTAFGPSEYDNSGSVGRLLPGIGVKLIDKNGIELVDTTQVGEISVKTPGVMMGYLNNKTATEETLADGWLNTGDMACCRDGKFYIVDRAKDIIKVRGWQVSPTEVEICLLKHPKVVDGAVVGLPDAFSGEKTTAFIVTPNSTERTTQVAADIEAFVAHSLASYKKLEGGVVFVEKIPRNPAGKILRRHLRAELLSGSLSRSV